jgi:RimJ/RimL family protein N-acetyltransferase
LLAGTSVILRSFAADDVQHMADILSDVEVLRLTGSLRSASDSSTAAGFSHVQLKDWYTTRDEHGDRLDLAIIDRGTDCLVGEIVLNDLRAEDETCSVRMPIGAAPRLDDTRIDSILMSILRPEWEAKQGAPRADGSP